MDTKKMREIIEKKYNKGQLYDLAGKNDIWDVKEGNGFIVFSLQNRSCSEHHGKSSGIGIREAWIAFDGKKEIVLIPMAMWRDKYSAHNDKPENHWHIEKIEDDVVVFKNDKDNPETKKIKFNFKKGGD